MVNFTNEELDFYLDLALNECQRWLEVTTRQRFIDEDYFLYSIRYGTQLRQVINRILPDCFQWTVSLLNSSKSHAIFDDDNQEDWVIVLLLICRFRLNLHESDLFFPEDLDFDEYPTFSDRCQSVSSANETRILQRRPHNEQEETPVNSRHYLEERFSGQDPDKLRRVCISICRLASINSNLPTFDHSALEPLATYHRWLHSSKREIPLICTYDRPKRAVHKVVQFLVDSACPEDSIADIANRPISSASIDGDLIAVASCSTVTDDSNKQENWEGGTNKMTTRMRDQPGKNAPSTFRDPLQFVSPRIGSSQLLTEQAKQQIQLVDEQKRLLRTRAFLNKFVEEDDEWLVNLNEWRTKRKGVFGKREARRNNQQEEKHCELHNNVPGRRYSAELFGYSPDSPADSDQWPNCRPDITINCDDRSDSGVLDEENWTSPGNSIDDKSSPSFDSHNSEFGQTETMSNDTNGIANQRNEREKNVIYEEERVIYQRNEIYEDGIEIYEGNNAICGIKSGIYGDENGIHEERNGINAENNASKERNKVIYEAKNGLETSFSQNSEKIYSSAVEKLSDIKSSELLTFDLQSNGKPFGFSISGGREHRSTITIDFINVGCPAAVGGLQIGDQIRTHWYMEVLIIANFSEYFGIKDGAMSENRHVKEELGQISTDSFDKKRNVFDRQKQVDSYYEFRQQRRDWEQKWPTKSVRNSTVGVVAPSLEMDSNEWRETRTTPLIGDYRVSSTDERKLPGKLVDFIPEVERAAAEAQGERGYGNRRKEIEQDCARRVSQDPKLLRNYDMTLLPNNSEAPNESKRLIFTEKDRTSEVEKSDNKTIEMPTLEVPECIDNGQTLDLPARAEKRRIILSTRSPSGSASRHPGSCTNADSELRYLRMAAGAHPFPTNHSNNDAHWMVERTERLTDQLRRINNNDNTNAKRNESEGENCVDQSKVATVSGKHLCSHCSLELGSAMIIECLDLFYHLDCFRCYVCNTTLGNGVQGTDVRVRGAKLHCTSCYSNDQVGLKFSQV